MANITKRTNKDGSVSYRIKVSAGQGADGRYVYRSATFTPPPKMTARQEAKAVQEFADDFERRVQDGLFTANDLTVDGLAERWMSDYCERQLKAYTVDGYRKLMPRVFCCAGAYQAVETASRSHSGVLQPVGTAGCSGGFQVQGRGQRLWKPFPKVHGKRCGKPPGFRSERCRRQWQDAMFPRELPRK